MCNEGGCVSKGKQQVNGIFVFVFTAVRESH